MNQWILDSRQYRTGIHRGRETNEGWLTLASPHCIEVPCCSTEMGNPNRTKQSQWVEETEFRVLGRTSRILSSGYLKGVTLETFAVYLPVHVCEKAIKARERITGKKNSWCSHRLWISSVLTRQSKKKPLKTLRALNDSIFKQLYCRTNPKNI